MEPLLSRFIAQAAPRARRKPATQSSALFRSCRVTPAYTHIVSNSGVRAFSYSRRQYLSRTDARALREREKGMNPYNVAGNESASYAQPASNISQTVHDEEKSHFARIEEESKEKQKAAPWMREGSTLPPVARNRSAGAMTKGKLLTTPSRMLKFILPLTTRDRNKDRKDIEPLALLVHPQQPLSYLERLVQSELPVMEDGKPPTVTFRAEDNQEDESERVDEEAREDEINEEAAEQEDISGGEEMRIDGKVEKTGKINSKSASSAREAAEENLPSHGHSSTASPPSHNESEDGDPAHANFVRWSPSTEIGDFIRDAARGKEFAVHIQNAPPIYVGVPSFADRTYYLRMRLRKTASRIAKEADVKRECDDLAQRGAKRVAQGGFAGLIGWWGVVYYLTFKTDLGWDVMEPVTYLVGLSGLIGGYLWFLYHNREVSYKSAMNFTVSRRQGQLYEQKGFDIAKWEGLVEEGNRLRREIKLVAEEYDVEWDETKDEGDEKVRQALREERKRKKEEKDEDDEEEDESRDKKEKGKRGKKG